MTIKFLDHQLDVINRLKTGVILHGDVGSGKSIAALGYYYSKVCGGELEPLSKLVAPIPLLIITTAKKRDSLEWAAECSKFMITSDPKSSINNHGVIIDSWNNINKYVSIKDWFVIFDEQRLIGSGSWVKCFYKIAKNNKWIILTATPGDTWVDYIPVFVANGFYKNRTEFLRLHVKYNNHTKFPKIDSYIDVYRLNKLRELILIPMSYQSANKRNYIEITVSFNKEELDYAEKYRWNTTEERPLKDISEYCFYLRKLTNSDKSRLEKVKELFYKHKKIIVFYSFDYELDILRNLKAITTVKELNGHKHDALPMEEEWIYLVQYFSGSEGWNCTETNTIVIYSLPYSYRLLYQSYGRIDRVNTKYKELFYYVLVSGSKIDKLILRALKEKRDFNESFLKKTFS
jgi:hypothetical protein